MTVTTTKAKAAPAVEPAAPTPQLRAATFATAIAGLWTMVTAGIVAVPAGVLAAVLVAGATFASMQLTTPGARDVRRRLAAAALAISAVGALLANGGELGDATGTLLGLLVCTAVVVHSLVLDSVRDQRVNLVVSLSMLLLSTGLAPGLSIALPVVVTWTCAVAAFVIASGEGQGANAPAQATVDTAQPGGPTLWSTVASVAAVTVLVGVALALVLPHPPGVSARSSFGTGDDQSRTPSGSAGRSASAYLGDGRLNLDSRGQLDDSPIAVVTGGAGALWRSNVLLRYDGHGWYPRRGRESVLLPTAAVPADPLSPPQPNAASQRDGVGWVGAAPPTVISPGIVTSVDLRQGQLVLDADGRLVPMSGSVTPTYVTTSDVVPKVATVSGPEIGGDASADVWRALPASVPARVTELAQRITAGAGTRAEAVRAVETYLRANATYDLESPVTPVRADTVDDFLFTSHRGFCEHFASAEVVLLRAVGIPSRMVSGFAAGAPQPDGTVVLRGSDAHAWVEVWIEGTGWTSSDPTAGATLADSAGNGLTGLLQKLIDFVTGSTTRKVVLAVVLLAVAAVVLWFAGRRRRGRDRDAAKLVPTSPLFAAFHRFEEALARTGSPRGPAESVRALSERVPPEVAGPLLTVERASYASVPPSRAEVAEATEAIDRASARLLAEAER